MGRTLREELSEYTILSPFVFHTSSGFTYRPSTTPVPCALTGTVLDNSYSSFVLKSVSVLYRLVRVPCPC